MTDTASEQPAGAVNGRRANPAPAGGADAVLGMTLLYAVWGGSWWIYSILFWRPI